MLGKIERKLLILNLLVFAIVIGSLCLGVYIFFVESLQVQAQNELSKLADSAISSIDFDGSANSGKPDLIVSALPDTASKSLMDIRVQWFEPNNKLSAEKGNFPLKIPFSQTADYQEQNAPHALVLTRPAILHGKTLGYVRVAHPLAETDEIVRKLTAGLLLGILAGLLVSGFGVVFLVRQSMSPIEQSFARLAQFTADASHEFRTPIMAIKTNSSVALKYDDGMRPKDREKFQAILDASEQMFQLSEALLTLARTDEHFPQGEIAIPVDVTQIIQEIVSSLAEESQKLVVLSLPANLLVCAEKEPMRTVFSNIISNAVQYTTAQGRIAITGLQTDSEIQVKIQDNGIGIAPEDISKIFDRFWRADKARSRRKGGQGLGLSVAKAFVNSCGGNISVNSQLGDGTTFIVSLPICAEVSETP